MFEAFLHRRMRRRGRSCSFIVMDLPTLIALVRHGVDRLIRFAALMALRITITLTRVITPNPSLPTLLICMGEIKK